MPYALIPEGYTLKKVTTAQEAAVHSKRRHDDVLALLNNENTPLIIGGIVTAVLVPVIAKQIAEDLGEDQGVIEKSVKTAFYEGTLLGKITKFTQGLDISKLDILTPRGLA